MTDQIGKSRVFGKDGTTGTAGSPQSAESPVRVRGLVARFSGHDWLSHEIPSSMANACKPLRQLRLKRAEEFGRETQCNAAATKHTKR
jgi:hypothetical protein